MQPETGFSRFQAAYSLYSHFLHPPHKGLPMKAHLPTALLAAMIAAMIAAPTLAAPAPQAEPPAFPAPQNLDFAKCKAKANRLN